MLLLAAGRGSRYGGSLPKAFLPLHGRPLLVHGAERLARALGHGYRWELVVVHHDDDRDHLAACLPALRAIADGGPALARGGSSRQQSMANGLQRCSADSGLVLVHDAARPFPPPAATRACVDAAARHGAALLALPAPDTLKRGRDGMVTATVDRADVWLAQTPQVIRRDLLVQALAHAAATGFEATDDVSLVEHLGAPVAIVPGSPTNLKITRPEDLPLAEAILAAGIA